MKTYSTILLAALIILTLVISATAQDAKDDAAAELAKKLANPVAALISVPLQYNYDAVDVRVPQIGWAPRPFVPPVRGTVILAESEA